MENNRKGKRLILDRRLLVAVGKGYLYKLPHPKNFFYDDLDVVVTSKGEVEKVVRILHFEANTITQTANAYIRVEDLIAKARTDSKEHEKMLHRLRYVPTFSSFEAFRRYLGQQPDLARFSKRNSAYQISVIIRLSWMMMPSWAKDEHEYNKFWGPVANKIPFNHYERG